MKHGDFTELAKFYVDRPGYSVPLLTMLRDYVVAESGAVEFKIADVGAGTGKLTEALENIGMSGYAVEPNDAMREEGVKLFTQKESFQWSKGVAENTNLPDKSVNWVLMGSSFHWADAPMAMAEFKRILRPNGCFTAIWNPRNIEASPLHMEIENIVYKELPSINRVSSGKTRTTEEMEKRMCSTGLFRDIVYTEAKHEEIMSVERYMNIWKSVNDIRVQAGEERFARILGNIEKRLEGMDMITVPYLSRAWTVRVIE